MVGAERKYSYSCVLEESLKSEVGNGEDSAAAVRSKTRFSSFCISPSTSHCVRGTSNTYHTLGPQELAKPFSPSLGRQT